MYHLYFVLGLGREGMEKKQEVIQTPFGMEKVLINLPPLSLSEGPIPANRAVSAKSAPSPNPSPFGEVDPVLATAIQERICLLWKINTKKTTTLLVRSGTHQPPQQRAEDRAESSQDRLLCNFCPLSSQAGISHQRELHM